MLHQLRRLLVGSGPDLVQLVVKIILDANRAFNLLLVHSKGIWKMGVR